ncbi:MAG TPA: ubiquinone biosynthesis protein UbiB, partial [Allosphingosinicella sp.]
MVMEEGVATDLDPDINMWETSEPFLREWIRSELGPEARLADEIVRNVRTLRKLPDLIRRLDYYYPPPGAAPPAPPLRDVLVAEPRHYGRTLITALLSAAAGAAAVLLLS